MEERLAAERPEPSAELVRSIVTEIRGATAGRRRRSPIRLVALAAAVLAGLAAIGGLGYAATYTARVVAIVTGSQSVSAHRSAATAARAQYGTTTAATTTAATTSTTTQTTGSGGEATTSAQPGSSGSVSTEAPGSTTPIGVSWSASTFTAPVSVTVDPTPAAVTTGGVTFAVGTILVSVTATNTNTSGAVTTLAAPLELVIPNAPSGFVPAVSSDGVSFRALTQISGPPLPADQQDGYFLAADGVHILTRHLTIFGVIAKSNVTVSETGRKLAPANSGRWGDPLRIHTGPPVLALRSTPTANGDKVAFTFFVDEQAALYFHVLSGGKELDMTGSSSVRGHKVGGSLDRTLHVPVLRPGTIPVTLVLKKPSGKLSILVIAVDYDGNKVIRTARVGR
ncbi:MAG: hypothetical protein ACYDCH_05420 [Gaiellaceae bacterium]